MKITSLDVYVVDVYRTNLVLIEIGTAEGLRGVGEATLEYREQAVVGALRDIEAELIGQDPSRIRKICGELYRNSYWRVGPVINSALSAVEMALWDLSAQELGVPVHRLLGGEVRDRVRVYANGWFAGARTPTEFGAAAQATIARGFSGVKFDPFETAYLTIDHAVLDRALAKIDAVRQAIGPAADLMIEAHGRFSPATAVTIARELEPYAPYWFEEPVPPESPDWLAQVKQKAKIPIAAGERLFTRADFADLFARAAVDFVQPDVSHAGGISELMIIAGMAETQLIGVAPHNPSGPVATAATLQLAAALPRFDYLEIMATDVPWRSELTDEKLIFTDGFLQIPDRAGLGLSLRPDRLADHGYQPHRLRHYNDQLTDIRPVDAVAYF